METLQRLSIADEREFLALPRALQERHLGHVYNLLTGAYEARSRKPASASPDPDTMRAIRALRGEHG